MNCKDSSTELVGVNVGANLNIGKHEGVEILLRKKAQVIHGINRFLELALKDAVRTTSFEEVGLILDVGLFIRKESKVS